MPEQFDPNSLNAILAKLEANSEYTKDEVKRMREDQTQHFSRFEKKFEKQDERLDSLERCRAKIVGFAAAAGTAGAGAGTWIKDFFTSTN